MASKRSVSGYFQIFFMLMTAGIIFASSEIALSQIVLNQDPRNPHLWEWGRVLNPSVVYDTTKQLYELWASDGYVAFRAISLDGRAWWAHEYGWDQDLTAAFSIQFLYAANVVRVDSSYYMYYSAQEMDGSIDIGLATSTDGETWTQHPSSPIIRPGLAGSWNSSMVAYPIVIIQDNQIKMWYSGSPDGIRTETGLATSADGIHWTEEVNNPVLRRGASFELDYKCAAVAGVTFVDNLYYLIYTAIDSIDVYSYCLATSSDGTTWTKSAANPLLRTGLQDSWNQNRLGGGTLLYNKGNFQFWYCADGTYNYFLMGYATSDNLVGVIKLQNNIPNEVRLEQNYPNPFNPSTTIRYNLPHKSHVMLTIFNNLGQRVKDIAVGEQEAGQHEVRFDSAGLSSGVYYCRLQAGDRVQTKKLMLIK